MTQALTVAEALERVADLIEPEGSWCDWPWARNDCGEELEYGSDPRAVSWCALGALEKIAGRYRDRTTPLYQECDNFLERHIRDGVIQFNGRSTQAEVVAKLREAAALAREQGK